MKLLVPKLKYLILPMANIAPPAYTKKLLSLQRLYLEFCAMPQVYCSPISVMQHTFPMSRSHVTMTGNVLYYQSPKRLPIQSQNFLWTASWYTSTFTEFNADSKHRTDLWYSLL